MREREFRGFSDLSSKLLAVMKRWLNVKTLGGGLLALGSLSLWLLGLVADVGDAPEGWRRITAFLPASLGRIPALLVLLAALSLGLFLIWRGIRETLRREHDPQLRILLEILEQYLPRAAAFAGVYLEALLPEVRSLEDDKFQYYLTLALNRYVASAPYESGVYLPGISPEGLKQVAPEFRADKQALTNATRALFNQYAELSWWISRLEGDQDFSKLSNRKKAETLHSAVWELVHPVLLHEVGKLQLNINSMPGHMALQKQFKKDMDGIQNPGRRD